MPPQIISNTTVWRPDPVSTHPLAGESGGLSGKPLFDMSTNILKEMYILTRILICIHFCWNMYKSLVLHSFFFSKVLLFIFYFFLVCSKMIFSSLIIAQYFVHIQFCNLTSEYLHLQGKIPLIGSGGVSRY